jgi:microcystin-dependent protein
MPRFVGQISLFPYSFQPQGWIFCDGRVLLIAEYDALFFRLRNTFGGNGESTFGVPDLRAAAPANCQYCISLEGTYEPDVNHLIM